MINCAHPSHFEAAIAAGEPWLDRVRGIRANASTASHAELDAATELDAGDPADLGRRYRDLRERVRRLSVMGGCCGTDHRHIAAICEACLPAATNRGQARSRREAPEPRPRGRIRHPPGRERHNKDASIVAIIITLRR
jgi:hypothetical protein